MLDEARGTRQGQVVRVNVDVELLGGSLFEARNATGATLRLEGTPELLGADAALTPMEALLASLAACSGVTVVNILAQQKEPLRGLAIHVAGTRAASLPAVFTAVHLMFTLRGPVAEPKARRAVALATDKYCAVSQMLEPAVVITHEVRLEP